MTACSECGCTLLEQEVHHVQGVRQGYRYWTDVCHRCAALSKWEAILGPVRSLTKAQMDALRLTIRKDKP